MNLIEFEHTKNNAGTAGTTKVTISPLMCGIIVAVLTIVCIALR